MAFVLLNKQFNSTCWPRTWDITRRSVSKVDGWEGSPCAALCSVAIRRISVAVQCCSARCLYTIQAGLQIMLYHYWSFGVSVRPGNRIRFVCACVRAKLRVAARPFCFRGWVSEAQVAVVSVAGGFWQRALVSRSVPFPSPSC